MKLFCNNREPLNVHCWTHILNLVFKTWWNLSFCSRTFDLSQKIYAVVEGSPKRHSEYVACVADMNLDDGLQILQSLCATRWAARRLTSELFSDVCLRLLSIWTCKLMLILVACWRAAVLASLQDFKFVFGVEFLTELFVLVNSTAEALHAKTMT